MTMPSLPEYGKPPIEEVAIGVQFEPIAKFHAVHIGRFWTKVRDQYPNVEEQPPLQPEMEKEKPTPQVPAIMFRPVMPIPRSWFLNASGNEFIQVQPDRFLRNWRKLKADEHYPRYDCLMAKFKAELQTFKAFLNEDSLDGLPKINQCELCYVNHLEPGAGWKGFSELARLFTLVREQEQGFLPEPELFSWQSRYKLADNMGRLHIEAQPVFRSRDFKLIISLTLKARGAPRSSSEEDVFSWFDVAHEWIVRGFDQVTAPGMHAIWEKK
jgi:uncharacterized protein (TIGR04255 family)